MKLIIIIENQLFFIDNMTKEELLETWVKQQHEGQVIKKSKKPYYSHVLAVASLAKNAVGFGYEIGLCHDLIEDTEVDQWILKAQLQIFGYNEKEAQQITAGVIELTDVFTSAAYPNLTKPERKKLELLRLLTISPLAQTVKYADVMDNTIWVLKYDHKHAPEYLRKKHSLLLQLNRGNADLRQKALKLIEVNMIKPD